MSDESEVLPTCRKRCKWTCINIGHYENGKFVKDGTVCGCKVQWVCDYYG